MRMLHSGALNRAIGLGVALVVALLIAGVTSTANATPTDDVGAPQVSDALGEYDPQQWQIVVPTPGEPSPLKARACGTFTRYGGGFNTNLGSGWTSLAARNGPCRAARSNGSWGTGSRFYVERETNQGEVICRGRLDGRASSVWYRTSKGWSWSGGTADPQWNRGC